MIQDLRPVELTVVDTNTAEWGTFPIPQLGVELPSMPLISDPDTGMQVLKLIYRAGFTNPWHTHPCAHGIYVLDGTLETHGGTFGAGSFVWFPEGGIMEHGAGKDSDCTFLFITNKPFDIHYPDKK
jgi:quercetin dioxygenase-like cupin family protein